MNLPLSKIAEFISATNHGGTAAPAFRPSDLRDEVAQGYSIDSRTVALGELFFAVKGERLDGHDYVDATLQKGAVAAVVQKAELHRYSDKSRLLDVDDTLVALQTLATAVRKLWGKPLIGITGSAGKTT
ncbi:MAG: Mur ligase domain-containing protein, partial [Burkholderiales bacterium]